VTMAILYLIRERLFLQNCIHLVIFCFTANNIFLHDGLVINCGNISFWAEANKIIWKFFQSVYVMAANLVRKIRSIDWLTITSPISLAFILGTIHLCRNLLINVLHSFHCTGLQMEWSSEINSMTSGK
jgi:hypothetical protein